MTEGKLCVEIFLNNTFVFILKGILFKKSFHLKCWRVPIRVIHNLIPWHFAAAILTIKMLWNPPHSYEEEEVYELKQPHHRVTSATCMNAEAHVIS